MRNAKPKLKASRGTRYARPWKAAEGGREQPWTSSNKNGTLGKIQTSPSKGARWCQYSVERNTAKRTNITELLESFRSRQWRWGEKKTVCVKEDDKKSKKKGEENKVWCLKALLNKQRLYSHVWEPSLTSRDRFHFTLQQNLISNLATNRMKYVFL